jgi:AcrR family transcriptional regulator
VSTDNARAERPSAKATVAVGGAGTRPGGRAARVVDAIMWATITELARTGYEMLRVDDIAVVAKVNKTTIYRRWPTKVDLVAAAIRASGRDLAVMPNTGSVRGDLLAMLAAQAEKYKKTEMRCLTRVFLGEISSPELARLVRSMRAEYRERWIEILRRGIARGDLPEGTPVEIVTDLISSASSMRLIRNDEPLDPAARGAMVDLVLAGAVAAVRRTGSVRQRATESRANATSALQRRRRAGHDYRNQ